MAEGSATKAASSSRMRLWKSARSTAPKWPSAMVRSSYTVFRPALACDSPNSPRAPNAISKADMTAIMMARRVEIFKSFMLEFLKEDRETQRLAYGNWLNLTISHLRFLRIRHFT